MGRSVLTHQFVAGLQSELKLKVAGSEGTFEELLAKARLEEAKLRDLPSTKSVKHPSAFTSSETVPAKEAEKGKGNIDLKKVLCNNCHAYGHFARSCPMKGRGQTRESTGRPPAKNSPRMAALVSEKEETQDMSEVESAIEQVTATLHGLSPTHPDTPQIPKLGPVPKVMLEVEGVPVEALVDTGAPASIVDLNFILNALAKKKKPEQSPSEWRAAVEKRLEQPSLGLQNYGGGELKLCRQIRVSVSRVGGKNVEAVLQVQNNAPVNLLLGTDLQSQLGFVLMAVQDDLTGIDLLQDKQWKISDPDHCPTPEATPEVIAKADCKKPVSEPTGNAVHLVQATRVPARHSKMIRARVEGLGSEQVSLF